MPTKILLVEDSADFQFLVKLSLKNNFHLDIASTLAEGRSLCARNTYDLYILDILLPDGSGYDFCTELQSNVNTRFTPVIFLTSKSTITEKVIGFSLGADDYITKPFIAAELYARVESKIKKNSRFIHQEERLNYGPFNVNISNFEVKLAYPDREQKVNLTPNEFKILVKLIKSREKIISREQIMDSVWGRGTYIADRTIDKHISSLRKKLGTLAEYIKTVPQFGYILSVEN